MIKYIVECDTKSNGGTWSFVQSLNDRNEYDTYREALAAVRVQQQKPAALKGTTHYRVGTIGEPEVTVYVVDMRAAELRVLAGLIADGDVQKLLPFHTSLGAGKNYVHIVNESAYVIRTNYHEIEEKDTICARAAGADWKLDPRYTIPTCPGCLAKAKRIIVEHILEKEYV